MPGIFGLVTSVFPLYGKYSIDVWLNMWQYSIELLLYFQRLANYDSIMVHCVVQGKTWSSPNWPFKHRKSLIVHLLLPWLQNSKWILPKISIIKQHLWNSKPSKLKCCQVFIPNCNFPFHFLCLISVYSCTILCTITTFPICIICFALIYTGANNIQKNL